VTKDGRERAVLAVQLKGAQHALKEALVYMSLVQKQDEVAVKEATKIKQGRNTTVEEVDMGTDDMEIEDGTKLTEMTICDKEMEFYVDDNEGRSDDEEVNENLEHKQKTKNIKKITRKG
jgi:hypothetical protein